jgi:hypothetical protein
MISRAFLPLSLMLIFLGNSALAVTAFDGPGDASCGRIVFKKNAHGYLIVPADQETRNHFLVSLLGGEIPILFSSPVLQKAHEELRKYDPDELRLTKEILDQKGGSVTRGEAAALGRKDGRFAGAATAIWDKIKYDFRDGEASASRAEKYGMSKEQFVRASALVSSLNDVDVIKAIATLIPQYVDIIYPREQRKPGVRI